MASLQLKLLGGFVAGNSTGRPIEIAGRKNQALLAYLALSQGKKVSREKLVGLLWSDRGEAQARSSLRQALLTLRRDLEGLDPPPLVFDGDAIAVDGSAVSTDAGQIHEAIVNLTTNAAHAIGPRAGSIEYRLEPAQAGEKFARSIPGLKPGHYARLTVSDSGCCMDAGTLERIFDAFYTTKPVGEGTGLGLSMVHGTMRSHGGAVTVESTPGKGSSFALYFPAAREKVGKEEAGAPAQSLPSPGQRVLYVDDEEALVFLAKRVLSRLGHSIVVFTDPREALEAFRAQPREFDIVVTDLSMPHMSGFDLAREVLALRPGMPVLVTTGYIRAEDEHAARAAGIRELILKPVTMHDLGRVLDAKFRNSEVEGTRPQAARS